MRAQGPDGAESSGGAGPTGDIGRLGDDPAPSGRLAGWKDPDPPGVPRGVLLSAAGWFTALVVSTLAFTIFTVVTGMPGEGETMDDLPLWAVAILQLPLWLGLAGAAVLASRWRGTGSLDHDFGLRVRGSDVPIGLACGLGAQLVVLPLLVPLYRLFDVDTDGLGEQARSLADRADGLGVVLLLLIVVVGAPLFEELFYRGLLLRSLERRMRPLWALLVSSVVFGVVHFQLLELPALTAFGLVAGWLAQRSGRLGAPIFAHVSFNAVAVASLLLTG